MEFISCDDRKLGIFFRAGKQAAVGAMGTSCRSSTTEVRARAQCCNMQAHGANFSGNVLAKVAHVATVALVTRRTITVDWYVHHCLPRVLDAVAPRRPLIDSPSRYPLAPQQRTSPQGKANSRLWLENGSSNFVIQRMAPELVFFRIP